MASIGYGCLLKRGDGGIGAGTKASVEWGSTNQKIRIKWKTAGTAGNGKNITVVVSGSSFVNTAIDSTQVSITAPTTATVAQVIAYLYSIPEFDLYWDADYGATPGDGSGTITARTVTATAGGTEGAEVFTTVAKVKGFTGPTLESQLADATTLDSVSGVMEFLPTLINPGQLSFRCLMEPTNTQQQGMRSDLINRVIRNFRITLSNAAASVIPVSAIVTRFGISAELTDALLIDCSLQITSTWNWS